MSKSTDIDKAAANAQLATRQDHEISARSQSILGMISAAATDPSCDVAKMTAMHELFRQVVADEKKDLYDQAMSRLQPRLPVITKEKKGANGKYASIENIDETIYPLLIEEGFHFTFTSAPGTNGKMVIKGKLNHRGGHHESAEMELAIDKSGSKNDTQGGGSTIAYGRRYLKCMMLDLRIIGEDRDGATGKTITEDQAMTIETLIANIPDEPKGYRLRCQSKLLGAMAVDKIGYIPGQRFGEAVNKLEAAARGPVK